MQEGSPPTLPYPADCPTLIHALAKAISQYGTGKVIAEDVIGPALTYQRFWWRTQLLANAFKPSIAEEDYIGLLLPTSLAGAVSFFALHQLGRIPVMLNFSAGESALKVAVEMIPLKRVITSHAFIEKAQLETLMGFLQTKMEIIYLEDIRRRIGKVSAAFTLLKLKLCGISVSSSLPADGNRPAVILFTSGSEGLPKGVALSHRNILSNIAQATMVLQFTAQDRMFNTLPIFHSFGLSAGTLLPLLLGIRVFFYPSPLHYKQIPKLCRDNQSTILLGTDTFLKHYANAAKDDDFNTLRLIVAGAEKLKESTSELYARRFGIEIMQGYGVTETSPILSCNAPATHKRGTVGKLLPLMDARLEPVEGIAEGGVLHVKGPNVMLGYIRHTQPGIIQSTGPWYDTGDVVTIDHEGYIRIIGRMKRFAKVGGEMVPLAVVEELAAQSSLETAHAAVAVVDERKGEQVILFTEDAKLTREILIQQAKLQGLSELYLPRRVLYVESLPRLGNGKLNYPAISKLHFS